MRTAHDHDANRFVRTPSGVVLPAGIDPFHQRLRRVAPAGLIGQTGQTVGMRRLEAISD
jgi:hypothetical protein